MTLNSLCLYNKEFGIDITFVLFTKIYYNYGSERTTLDSLCLHNKGFGIKILRLFDLPKAMVIDLDVRHSILSTYTIRDLL